MLCAKNKGGSKALTLEKGSNTSTPTTRSEAVQDWAVADVQEFVPQGFEHVAPLQGNGNGGITPGGAFDPFVTTPTPMTPGAVGPVSANPYSHDPTGAMGGAFFASQTGFQQPVRFGDQRILLLFASYKF